MKTPEQIAEHTAWQLYTARKKSDHERIILTRSSLVSHLTGAVKADRAQAVVPGGPEQIADAVFSEYMGGEPNSRSGLPALLARAVTAGITAAWESWEPDDNAGAYAEDETGSDLIAQRHHLDAKIRAFEFPRLMEEEVTDDGETYDALRCPECKSIVDSESLVAVSPAEHHATAEDLESDDAHEHCRITFYSGERPDLEETLYYLHNEHPVALPEGWTEGWS